MKATFLANRKKVDLAKRDGKDLIPTYANYNKMMFLVEDKEIDEETAQSISPSPEDKEVDEETTQSPEEFQIVKDVVIEVIDNTEEQEEDTEPKWSTEMEVSLIDFFKDNPELWNHKLEDYKKAGKSGLMDTLGEMFDKKFSSK